MYIKFHFIQQLSSAVVPSSLPNYKRKRPQSFAVGTFYSVYMDVELKADPLREKTNGSDPE